MHDLATIERLNDHQTLREAEAARSRGRHVVIRYTGLHAVSFTSHDNLLLASAAFAACNEGRSPDERYVLLEPMTPAQAAAFTGRDQSEDRVAA